MSYFIYRVYDAKGLYPKFYRAAGCISDNFILDLLLIWLDINIVKAGVHYPAFYSYCTVYYPF